MPKVTVRSGPGLRQEIRAGARAREGRGDRRALRKAAQARAESIQPPPRQTSP